MTHWDGLTSANTSGKPERILILGATNRMQDIDDAILRRMPKKFPISLPAAPQRRRILDLVLHDTKLDGRHFDAEYLVRVMAGMSGSDIKEACRDAALVPVRQFIRQKREQGERMEGINPDEVRGLRTEDFFSGKASLQTVAEEYLPRRRGKVEEEELTEEEDEGDDDEVEAESISS